MRVSNRIQPKKKISIITPCFNEEGNVRECALAVKNMMSSELPEYEYEHIFADNASTDNTKEVIHGLADSDPRIKLIVNSRNVGPFRNMWNAMKSATGDAVIPLMPADLQDPPSVIPAFVHEWEKGYLVCFGVRSNREEKFLMRLTRSVYYKVINKLSFDTIPEDSGEFLLADRKIIDSILQVDDEYPYIRGLVAQTGVVSSRVEYTWVKRKNGKSKNSFVSLVDQGLNGLVSTSRVPARLAIFGGFLMSATGILFAAYTILNFLILGTTAPQGITTIIVGLFLLGGIQLIFLGVIGEYVLSIHSQVRKAPRMFEVVRKNFDL
jgi:glycosyltransferase involved in cell wall biosynthesis